MKRVFYIGAKDVIGRSYEEVGDWVGGDCVGIFLEIDGGATRWFAECWNDKGGRMVRPLLEPPPEEFAAWVLLLARAIPISTESPMSVCNRCEAMVGGPSPELLHEVAALVHGHG